MLLRQVARQPAGRIGQADKVQRVVRRGLRLTLLARQARAAHQRVPDPGRGALAVPDEDIFERRGILEERRRLERSRHASPRDVMRLQAGHVLAIEQDAAAR